MQDTIKEQIVSIWEKYISDNELVLDTKGNVLDNIDDKRLEAIQPLKTIIDDFITGKIDIAEFKTKIDSFNKKNNLWGFTSIKGQMFFNLLLKTSESEIQQKNLAKLLKECVIEPKDLPDAMGKIEAMDKYT